MVKKLEDLPVGTKVKYDGAKDPNGSVLTWIIVDQNHEGYPENSTTVITNTQLSGLKEFSSKNGSGDSHNQYSVSNIDQWLNANEDSGRYKKLYSGDAEPSYVNEKGFLTNLNDKFKSYLLNTNIINSKNNKLGNGSEEITRKIFLLSGTEFSGVKYNNVYEGKQFAYFSNFSNSQLNKERWLRTPSAGNTNIGQGVNTVGTVYPYFIYSSYGVRPLCNLKSDATVSDEPDSNGVYTLTFNKTLTRPTGLSAPAEVKYKKDTNITWKASTDPDADSITYILERKYDNEAYNIVYKGPNLSTIDYQDNVPSTAKTLVYRVKATDSVGNESGYTYTGTVNIKYNDSPVITTSANTNLGAFKESFKAFTYSFTDSDTNQKWAIETYLNGDRYEIITDASKKAYTFDIPHDKWIRLPNGTHKIKIMIDDTIDIGSKEFTFIKDEDRIEWTLEKPLESEYEFTRAVLSLNVYVPDGASILIEACNNAFDPNPERINVTDNALNKTKIFFTNKEATRWGFNLRFSIDRAQAKEISYIYSIGGNFE